MAFLNDITLGQYVHGDSFLHRLDPRTKLLASLMFMTALFISAKPELLLLQVVVCLLGFRGSGLSAKVLARNLRPFLWLFLITGMIHAFTTPGKAVLVFPFVHLTVSQEGLLQGGIYSLRLALLILFAAFLTMTTSPMELTDSLERLLAPLKRLKVPVHDFTMMMTLSLRFLPLLLREAERIKNAQLSRGASLEGGLLERVKNIIPMIVPLFVSAIRRADDLALAMEARNYVADAAERTSFRSLHFSLCDVQMLLFTVAVMGTVVVLH